MQLVCQILIVVVLLIRTATTVTRINEGDDATLHGEVAALIAVLSTTATGLVLWGAGAFSLILRF